MNPKESRKELELKKNLSSKNEAIVIATLNEIELLNKIQFLPEIIELLLKNKNVPIQKKIAQILTNLKNPDAIPYLVNALNEKKLVTERPFILTSCWQSRLDYSHYIETFVDIAIQENYATALEALTVIEYNMNITDALREQMIDKIKHNLNDAETDKRNLLSELIRVLQEM